MSGKTPGNGNRAWTEWTARLVFLAVFIMNVMCAVQFIADPAGHAGAYELSGTAGEAAIRGIGVAFLMWNATYPAFIVSPRRFKALGAVILSQQAVGLAGETYILRSLPEGHEVLSASILRFIVFDGAGLAVMLAGYIILLIKKERG
ncbi:MAG: hypothetical protein K5637_06140 [Lachnospiraceae bacterium]|nr:hypothetical protein [Lachnospiraceae bacterium]